MDELTASARALAIVQVGATDHGGGAATVAAGLMRGYAARGHQVWHVVGRKGTGDPGVLPLPDDDRPWFSATGYVAVQVRLRRLAERHPNRGFGLLSRSLRMATHPRAIVDHLNGIEDFAFPASARLLDQFASAPDVVHAHNLHGGYFDLRALAPISARLPTVLTLHDMWLMTGHCAHALGCGRWQTGCGQCPDLTLDPPIRRDATDRNWRRKQEVFAASRVHLAAPSRWLRDQVGRSMLAPSAGDVRVIPNGVDTSVFRPADRRQARARLGLPDASTIILLTAGSSGSMWKDDRTLARLIDGLAARRRAEPLVFVAVGREFAARSRPGAAIRSVPVVGDPRVMAQYYQSADLYLHAARADTFPLAVLEAMACGTPVVATAVGGIPEQIRPAAIEAVRAGRRDGIGDATGMLVPPAGAVEMTDAVEALLDCEPVRVRLGENAARDVASRFTLDRQVEAYLAWYRDLLGARAEAERGVGIA
ncbi:MAG: glycosyltransferase [Vicinamibacterales bacterium]